MIDWCTCGLDRRVRVSILCYAAIAVNAKQLEGLSYCLPLLLYFAMMAKCGYRYGGRLRLVDFD